MPPILRKTLSNQQRRDRLECVADQGTLNSVLKGAQLDEALVEDRVELLYQEFRQCCTQGRGRSTGVVVERFYSETVHAGRRSTFGVWRNLRRRRNHHGRFD